VIARLLSDKGFEIFLPLYKSTRRWKDRVKELSLPLFPCYLFVWGGLDRRLYILATPGIRGFVTVGSRPAVLQQSEIDAIRQAVTECSLVEPHPFLRSGDLVKIKSGPLVGIEGILVRKKKTFHLVLSVELLQRSVAVEVDANLVERLAGRR
jgi:transcription antitermination factor NusG